MQHERGDGGNKDKTIVCVRKGEGGATEGAFWARWSGAHPVAHRMLARRQELTHVFARRPDRAELVWSPHSARHRRQDQLPQAGSEAGTTHGH